ncbi:MAG: DNA polymerase III subunit alpha [Clostridia bacterium]|nr:DNA polymerase III subunit alpha [Clostridia bacterium]
MIASNEFVHLHLHSEYSLLDGAVRVADIPRLAKEAGHTAVALTDHGVMYGAVAFYRACKAEGIKPIIGCEVYVAPKSRFIKTADRESNYYHLVLLCENEQGYRNLTALVSRAFTEGFYGKPRVDNELLAQYHEGLICLSACLGGYIPSLLSRGDYDEAKRYALFLRDTFGADNFFLELQDHGIAEQREVNRGLRHISDECGIPTVVTGDVHYPRRRDADAQAILMCIQTNSVITDGRPLGFETDEYFYKSTEELAALFPEDEEAMRNTSRIADRCQFDFCFDKLYLPVFETPDGTPAPEFLLRLAHDGFLAKIRSGALTFTDAHPIAEYRERIDYEWRVICETGYAEYYLIVWDFIRYAKSVNIPVGPGRGSGAGSLIAYLIGITDVDSIRYSLMFERFLNPERVSMPDFDIDFCDTRRGEVIDYVRRRYGEDHVAQIVTFGTLAARAAVRDVGRALGMSYAAVDEIAKMIPQDLHMTLDRALEQKDLKEKYEGDTQIRTLIDLARALEGMPRHASTHAAGVVITDRPVMDYVPLAENGGMTVTQFDMDTVAMLGLLKIDFLGLRYLTILSDTEEMVRERDPAFSLAAIPMDDAETFAMIGRGQTLGVFQLESGGMRNMLTQLMPENLEMIVAAISLYRPGPMDSIPKFLSNRQNPADISYPTPLLADILDVTFGCIVYQEQVMQICRTVAGYTFGRADVVRRAMAKKKSDVMALERQAFIFGQRDADGNVINTGALAAGLDEAAAGALFDDMAGFAKYAFNKAHASAYAITTYRTAYLKRHYPGEYLASMLTSVTGNVAKTSEYIAEAWRLHIPIIGPDINESGKYFRYAERDGKWGICFGLMAVRNVGAPFIEQILTERSNHGPFENFEDFISRMADKDCTKRQLEPLIASGAFDRMPEKRSQMLACYEKIMDLYLDRARTAVTGQLDLFSAAAEDPAQSAGVRMEGFRYPDIPEISGREKLLLERSATGQCFSGHLLDDYSLHLAQLKPTEIGTIISSFEAADPENEGAAAVTSQGDFADKQTVSIAGLVTKRVAKQTRKGDSMAFITVEDRYAEMEVVVFPKVLESCAAYLSYDTAVFVTGELSVREEEAPKLLARAVFPLRTNDAVAAEEHTEGTGSDRQTGTSSQTPASPTGRSGSQGVGTARARTVSDTPIPQGAKTLYLRVPRVNAKDLIFAHAENYVHIFSAEHGSSQHTVSVVFYDSEQASYHRDLVPPLSLTPYVLHQFETLLGSENVILK